jgi:hypothetical protein
MRADNRFAVGIADRELADQFPQPFGFLRNGAARRRRRARLRRPHEIAEALASTNGPPAALQADGASGRIAP